MKSENPDLSNSKLNSLTGVKGLLLAVVAIIALTTLLKARVAYTDQQAPRPPLAVSTSEYTVGESYQRQVRYLGLVASSARANLGFEIGGILAVAPLREGTPVKAGQTIASLDTEALQLRRKALAAELKQVQLDLELAQLREKRQRDLRKTKAISIDAYDETRLAANSLQAREQSMQAQLAGIDLELTKSVLVAPYDGIIADRTADQGTVVAPGTPVVRLIGTNNHEAHIGVSAQRSKSLVVGQDYPLVSDDEQMSATLLSIRPDVDPITRSTTAVFALPENVSVLDGETISLLLSEDIAISGGWLPLESLQEGERGLWTVLRVQKNEQGQHIVVREAVEVLDVIDQLAYVRGTLADGSQVVSSGLQRIVPGSEVAVESTTAPQNDGAATADSTYRDTTYRDSTRNNSTQSGSTMQGTEPLLNETLAKTTSASAAVTGGE